MATPPDLQDEREPLTPRFEPGFFTESSERGAPTRWRTGDKVRFKNAQAEKLGGWESQAITGALHRGVPRRGLEWSSLDGESWIAEATNSKLYLINRNVRYDITPVRRSLTLTNPFTTNGTESILVEDDGHSSNVGDAVRYTGASAVSGVTITGEYIIAQVIDGNFYRITHTSPAGGIATGGGTVQVEYDINAGTVDQGIAVGYGTCGYGEDPYGTARDEACSDVVRRLALWSLDNFGEDLIASPRGGAVYWWDRTTGPLSRAVVLESAPRTNQRVLISGSGDQIICLGAYDDVAGSPDPMLVRVGAIGSLTDFTVRDGGTAFDKRLSTGSEIITGVRTSGGVLIETDKASYFMRPDAAAIFDINQLGEGNTGIAPNAMLEVDGIAFWLADSKIMAFDGVLQEIPCDIWQEIFGKSNDTRILVAQADKIYCWYNEDFSEIWWHYPSVGGNGENDRYVIFNKELRCFYAGTIIRTIGMSPGPTYKTPIAFEPDGDLFLHESGVDDDGAAMDSSIRSHQIQLGEGKIEMQVSEVVPDLVRQTGDLLLHLQSRKHPNAPLVEKGPYTIRTTTRKKGVKIKGRQISVEYQSNVVGGDYRLGDWTYYYGPDSEG